MKKSRSGSRRDFFRSFEYTSIPEDFRLLRLSRPAMGSVFEILFNSNQRSFVDAAHRALDEVRRLEKLMTVFSEDSEISVVNQWGFIEPVPVSPEVLDVLGLGQRVYEQTKGAFDITSGILSKTWGFKNRQGSIPMEAQISEAVERIGSDQVRLDPYSRTVSFLREGIELNLGSIGKGFALDHAALILQNEGLESVLLHAGYSSFKALGDPVNSKSGWKISIRHPMDSKKELLTLRLRDHGMATSGSGEQHFEIDGRKYGHILDPRTGYPTDHHLSVTALAPTAAAADALSTAFFVMSTEDVGKFCKQHTGTGAIVIPTPDEGNPVEIVCFGTASDVID